MIQKLKRISLLFVLITLLGIPIYSSHAEDKCSADNCEACSVEECPNSCGRNEKYECISPPRTEDLGTTTETTAKTDTETGEDESDTADDARQTTIEDINLQRLQDFDGVIPSPGLKYRDRDQVASRDIGKAIQNGDVHLDDIFIIAIKFVDLAAKLAGSFCVIMIMWSGLQYLGSGLTDDKESAKNTLKWAIVGLIASMSGWVIVSIVKSQLTGSI